MKLGVKKVKLYHYDYLSEGVKAKVLKAYREKHSDEINDVSYMVDDFGKEADDLFDAFIESFSIVDFMANNGKIDNYIQVKTFIFLLSKMHEQWEYHNSIDYVLGFIYEDDDVMFEADGTKHNLSDFETLYEIEEEVCE